MAGRAVSKHPFASCFHISKYLFVTLPKIYLDYAN